MASSSWPKVIISNDGLNSGTLPLTPCRKALLDFFSFSSFIDFSTNSYPFY